MSNQPPIPITAVAVTLLRCSVCKEWKVPDAFYKNRATKSGRKNYCKVCLATYRKERRVAARTTPGGTDLANTAELERLGGILDELGWTAPQAESEPAST